MKRFLITGGAGFIGSHVVDRLIGSNEVVVFDNLSKYYGNKEKNIKKYFANKNFKFIRASILNTAELNRAMKDIDIVVHLAAQPGVRYSLKNPVQVAKINVAGTVNVLELSIKNGIKKIIFASSSSVYGNLKKLPASEGATCNPISPYGVSKLCGEFYCRYFSSAYGLEIPMLRFFTVYGPKQRPDMAIYKFINSVMKNESPIIFGDGEQTRDFTYISDTLDGITLAIEKNVRTEIFNLGGGNSIPVNELVDLIIELNGKKGIVKPIHLEGQKGDVIDTLADNKKAKEYLGWRPKVKIRSGLEKTIEWFKHRNSP